ncbi:hypothetical protein Anapl_10248 [Anas platyrhynchos]|uniref:Uncharacterized protein n=1 Tax=Anas platyrhynchos TaxID=8839 RepID=R0L6G6_ANAPL|nr:hypothetical protein Anapl_10248 [Anas platyrhynchos]
MSLGRAAQSRRALLLAARLAAPPRPLLPGTSEMTQCLRRDLTKAGTGWSKGTSCWAPIVPAAQPLQAAERSPGAQRGRGKAASGPSLPAECPGGQVTSSGKERWQPAVFPATTPTLGYSKSFAQEFVSLQSLWAPLVAKPRNPQNAERQLHIVSRMPGVHSSLIVFLLKASLNNPETYFMH